MQRFVSKYGAAAHLALLAVAPLFLFPYCSSGNIATVLIWLSPLVALWILLEPSRRSDEMLHNARIRVAKSIVTDPLFWVMLVVAVVAGLRCLNDGVALAYDAEAAKWYVKEASVKFLPGATAGSGRLPFACSIAILVLVEGCRHALGRSARASFLFSMSTLAGVAAIAAISAVALGHPGAVKATELGLADTSFAGTAFGLHFLAGLVALVGAFEQKWVKQFSLFAFALGGTSAGLYFFAPTTVSLLFLAAGVLVLLVGVGYAGFALGEGVPYKCVAVVIIAAAIPCLCAMGLSPEGMNVERLAPFGEEGGSFFKPAFFPLREILSGIAAKSWSAHPWVGTGLGSFTLDVRFAATPDDWAVLPVGTYSPLNGWWEVLSERGILGMVSLLLPLAFIAFTFFRRLIGAFRRPLFVPACVLGPVALAAVAAEMFFDASALRADAMMAVGALFALSASSFPAPAKAAKDAKQGS